MKSKTGIVVVVSASVALLTTGCATKTNTGLAIGTGVGATLGALVGGNRGAMVGGAMGAAAGGAIGHNEEKKDRMRGEYSGRYYGVGNRGSTDYMGMDRNGIRYYK